MPTAELDLMERARPGVADLLPLVYQELHELAERYLRRERRGHTLQPTALVHEVCIRLIRAPEFHWQDRSHFVALAARAMRQVLVNHAVARKAEKRGGGARRMPLDDAVTLFEQRGADLQALDDALNALAEFDPDQARIVELRFFGGLTTQETAEVLGMSTRTVEREWTLARAWLKRELAGA